MIVSKPSNKKELKNEEIKMKTKNEKETKESYGFI